MGKKGWKPCKSSLLGEDLGEVFCYIYNIMSYPTFRHQKNPKNPTSHLRYLSISTQKFTTIVKFTILVKIRQHLYHHISQNYSSRKPSLSGEGLGEVESKEDKIHCFTESVKKFAFIFFWIILRKIHCFIE